ncbi:MAG TPA: proton-conducting transporter membrane subunit, partial [Erythrobacter sp.]|nr:proton-conducting transporter membrane subunit [Erythrobacter sp.]
DGLAMAFVTMTTLVMAAVLVSARPQFAGIGQAGETRSQWAFWPLALLLWSALNVAFLSRDLFNLYVALELLTVAAVALVAIEGKADALAAALRYMMFALLGSLAYLLGAALLYAAHGTLDLALLAAQRIGEGAGGGAPADWIAAGLMTAGLAVKTALFPFHAWLPPAHSGAPAPASAMLSALVPKASFVILIRLWFEALPALASPVLLLMIGAMAASAVIFGSLLALRQTRFKLIIAYSTVAQIGYLFLVFPLAGGDSYAQPWSAGAWTGAMFQALSHGLAKAAMFLCAGVWIIAAGHDRLEGMRGLARATPMTAFAFGLAAVTLIGLPPSGGFTAKYLMLTAAFASGQWAWGAVLVVGGLLAAAYLYRPMGMIFARDESAIFRHVPGALQVAPLLLALAAMLLGVMTEAPFGLLQIGRPASAAEGLE